MVVKETLRLHPPVPLLLPRETKSHFELNGYDIGSKTRIYMNAWTIGRNPDSWKNPQEFCPDHKFMESVSMAMATVELALANMLLCFDWKLPNGMEEEEDIDMEEEFGTTVSKKSPLHLLPIPY
ncbi:cytochrome P450 71B37-like [Cucumis melo var. makuwa]|uniref:Cytochrome P450 71B37-like n=2 Tax=Cucumis melo TaxID=3656 RepID=A0A5A7SWK7_CUCMM|nr:cytochrome P450 71B37-like [Cucumis melo var. makuwa]TYK15665.1 cytochrome P450 71B37-like [Cucumis melo var. makuwa]